MQAAVVRSPLCVEEALSVCIVICETSAAQGAQYHPCLAMQLGLKKKKNQTSIIICKALSVSTCKGINMSALWGLAELLVLWHVSHVGDNCKRLFWLRETPISKIGLASKQDDKWSWKLFFSFSSLGVRLVVEVFKLQSWLVYCHLRSVDNKCFAYYFHFFLGEFTMPRPQLCIIPETTQDTANMCSLTINSFEIRDATCVMLKVNYDGIYGLKLK